MPDVPFWPSHGCKWTTCACMHKQIHTQHTKHTCVLTCTHAYTQAHTHPCIHAHTHALLSPKRILFTLPHLLGLWRFSVATAFQLNTQACFGDSAWYPVLLHLFYMDFWWVEGAADAGVIVSIQESLCSIPAMKNRETFISRARTCQFSKCSVWGF